MNNNKRETLTMPVLLPKKLLCFTGVIVFAVFFYCSEVQMMETGSTSDTEMVGSVKIRMSVAPGSPFSKLAHHAEVTIAAPDMITLTSTLTTTDSTVEGTVSKIPAGKDRLLTVNVFDSMNTLQYAGSDTVTIQADTETVAQIDVHRIRGDLTVDAAIVDTNLPYFRSLVAYYPFNGNARDGSGHSIDGRASGAVLTTDRFGRRDSAYQFDGTDDYINVAYSADIDCEDSITVALWAKSNIPGRDYTGYASIIQMGNGTEFAYAIGLNVNYSLFGIQLEYRQHWRVLTGTNAEILGADIIDGAVRYETELDTAWHFYAFSFDGDTIRAYVDSVFLGKKVALPGEITNTRLSIGVQSKTLAGFWNGKIDDIRIYHRALSSEEIMKLRSLEN